MDARRSGREPVQLSRRSVLECVRREKVRVTAESNPDSPRLDSQRLPPPRFPPPPLRFPPPPPRLPPPPPASRGRASLTLILRPLSSVSLNCSIARAASAASAISTNPKPLD